MEEKPIRFHLEVSEVHDSRISNGCHGGKGYWRWEESQEEHAGKTGSLEIW